MTSVPFMFLLGCVCIFPFPPVFDLKGGMVKIYWPRNHAYVFSGEIAFDSLNLHEKSQITQWLNSAFKGSLIDFVSHVPSLTFEGEVIKVDFLEDHLVLSYRKDPNSAWKQFSRRKTNEDHKIQLMIEKIAAVNF